FLFAPYGRSLQSQTLANRLSDNLTSVNHPSESGPGIFLSSTLRTCAIARDYARSGYVSGLPYEMSCARHRLYVAERRRAGCRQARDLAHREPAFSRCGGRSASAVVRSRTNDDRERRARHYSYAPGGGSRCRAAILLRTDGRLRARRRTRPAAIELPFLARSAFARAGSRRPIAAGTSSS